MSREEARTLPNPQLGPQEFFPLSSTRAPGLLAPGLPQGLWCISLPTGQAVPDAASLLESHCSALTMWLRLRPSLFISPLALLSGVWWDEQLLGNRREGG